MAQVMEVQVLDATNLASPAPGTLDSIGRERENLGIGTGHALQDRPRLVGN
ncbi:hypothetical protein D3C84_1177320 [compost metagenome]